LFFDSIIVGCCLRGAAKATSIFLLLGLASIYPKFELVKPHKDSQNTCKNNNKKGMLTPESGTDRDVYSAAGR